MILDTNALSAWLDGDQGIAFVLEEASDLLLSPIVLGEYRFGIQASRNRSEYLERILLIEEDLQTLPIDGVSAGYYSVIRHELKAKGTPIPWHDLWIAAQAKQHSLPILSRDTHFDCISGIKRISW